MSQNRRECTVDFCHGVGLERKAETISFDIPVTVGKTANDIETYTKFVLAMGGYKSANSITAVVNEIVEVD